MTISVDTRTIAALNLMALSDMETFFRNDVSSVVGVKKKFWSDNLFKDFQSHEDPKTGLRSNCCEVTVVMCPKPLRHI
jgi:hypothetical protein